jgi:hypothetical protein
MLVTSRALSSLVLVSNELLTQLLAPMSVVVV